MPKSNITTDQVLLNFISSKETIIEMNSSKAGVGCAGRMTTYFALETLGNQNLIHQIETIYIG